MLGYLLGNGGGKEVETKNADPLEAYRADSLNSFPSVDEEVRNVVSEDGGRAFCSCFGRQRATKSKGNRRRPKESTVTENTVKTEARGGKLDEISLREGNLPVADAVQMNARGRLEDVRKKSQQHMMTSPMKPSAGGGRGSFRAAQPRMVRQSSLRSQIMMGKATAPVPRDSDLGPQSVMSFGDARMHRGSSGQVPPTAHYGSAEFASSEAGDRMGRIQRRRSIRQRGYSAGPMHYASDVPPRMAPADHSDDASELGGGQGVLGSLATRMGNLVFGETGKGARQDPYDPYLNGASEWNARGGARSTFG